MIKVVFWAVVSLAAFVALTVRSFSNAQRADRLEAKAQIADSICSMVKHRIELDATALTAPDGDRDQILDGIGMHFGNNVTAIWLCSAKTFVVDDFNACAASRDYECAARMLLAAAKAIK